MKGNFKKLILLPIIMLLIIFSISTFSEVKAESSLTLNIKWNRGEGYGYQFNSGSTSKMIWKIYEVGSSANETFYCIKGGPGFGSTNFATGGVPSAAGYTYNRAFNLKKPSTIGATYKAALPQNSKNYEALLWVLDHCYVPAKDDTALEQVKAEQSLEVLKNAIIKFEEEEMEKVDSDEESYANPDFSADKLEYLTTGDIEAAQQLAIWYYTNNDEYHIGDRDSSGQFQLYLNPVAGTPATPENYQALGDFTNGSEREIAAQCLFDYLVRTPQREGFSYAYTEADKQPVELDKSKIVEIVTDPQDSTKYLVGPYKINELKDIDYTLTGTLRDKNNTQITTNVKIKNELNELEITNSGLETLVGKDFYLSIPITTDTTKLTYTINGTYYTTETEYWSVETPGTKDQPIVRLRKMPATIEDYIVKKPETQEVDLALRKFITAINRVELENDDRVPKINSSEVTALYNGYKDTATKVHSKIALPVKTNDIVEYTIRVYNEGNLAGYASEITDHLPSGLQLIPKEESEINRRYGWTSTDGKTIKTDYLKTTLLEEVKSDSTELSHADIKIECRVIAIENENLKNIAEITQYKDKDENVINKDRDSEPNNLSETGVLTDADITSYGITQKQDDDDFEQLELVKQYFDLALRKYVYSVNGNPLTGSDSRVPTILQAQIEALKNGATTAVKEHTKVEYPVKTNDTIIYHIRVYNEGELAGYAAEVTDHLPTGLTFVSDSELNRKYGWTSTDGKTIKTNILAPDSPNKANWAELFTDREDSTNPVLLKAFDGTNIDYIDLAIECKVTAVVATENQFMENIAEITKYIDVYGIERESDRDSRPNNLKDVLTDTDINNFQKEDDKHQDDEDYELLVLMGQYFDLSLRKFITEVQNGEDVKTYDRAPTIDVSTLLNGENTAIYKGAKTPVSAINGSIVTYTIRVYNEGQLDGYVTEITDHLPKELEFIDDDPLNIKYGWLLQSGDGRTVKTNITSPNTTATATRDEIYKDRTDGTDKVLLTAFDGKDLNNKTAYIDVQIRCKVKDDIVTSQKITNIAEITGFMDKNKNTVIDRDSGINETGTQKIKVKLPTDEQLPEYKGNTANKDDLTDSNYFYKGQEDDDDFEKLVVQRFDLALRKFITKVEDKDITGRAPVFNKISSTEFKYVHPKDPVEVANGNIVIYTLRVFNEGNVDGYAKEVKDDLPEGLEFLPEDTTNTAFRWKMYKEDGTETTNVDEASYIKTDFLSKQNETTENGNLIKAFDQETMDMPDYKDLKIAFKVNEPATEDRVIINTAEITDDSDKEGKPVEDIDSTPDNNKEGEDDIDIEKIKVKYFDLSLKKWVTESIVTYNGKTTVTKTGHTEDTNPETPAKVEIRGSRVSKTTVKFKFNIKVKNEGEIEGYATELIDYIPEGLKFVASDNPKWKEVDGKVVTDQLKDTLLQPGESATVEIILTWINNKDNMGLKTNWAEINKDDNPYNSPDIDSTPGNNTKGEDDIDDAPVIIATVTGAEDTIKYITLILASTSMLAAGVILIKKFVL